MERIEFKDMIHFVADVIEQQKLFEGLELEPLDEYLGIDIRPAREIKRPMAYASYKAFRIKGSDKIDKIAYGELHYMGRAKYCAMNMTVSDDYDLPIFSCEFLETAKRLSITVDCMPLVDTTVHPEYRTKYLNALSGVWRKYRTIPGLTDEEGRCLVQRRYHSWPWARAGLSHYPVDGRISGAEDRRAVVEAIQHYAKIWIGFLKEAQPIREEAYKKEMLRRKRTLQHYYRTLDPGGGVIKKLIGADMEKLIITLAF